MDAPRYAITSHYHFLTQVAVVNFLSKRRRNLRTKRQNWDESPILFLNVSGWHLAGATRNYSPRWMSALFDERWAKARFLAQAEALPVIIEMRRQAGQRRFITPCGSSFLKGHGIMPLYVPKDIELRTKSCNHSISKKGLILVCNVCYLLFQECCPQRGTPPLFHWQGNIEVFLPTGPNNLLAEPSRTTLLNRFQ